jgi:hypothetical protein
MKPSSIADAWREIQTPQGRRKQPSSSDPATAQKQQTELQGKMTQRATSGLDVSVQHHRPGNGG